MSAKHVNKTAPMSVVKNLFKNIEIGLVHDFLRQTREQQPQKNLANSIGTEN